MHQESQPELQFRLKVHSEVSSGQQFLTFRLSLRGFECGTNCLCFHSDSFYFRDWGREGPQQLGSSGPGSSMVFGTGCDSSTELCLMVLELVKKEMSLWWRRALRRDGDANDWRAGWRSWRAGWRNWGVSWRCGSCRNCNRGAHRMINRFLLQPSCPSGCACDLESS
jgi:hypothetical protein